MIPAFLVSVAPTSSGVSSSAEFSVELGAEVVFGQLDTVARDPGETDLQMVPLRADGVHVDRLARRLGRRGDPGAVLALPVETGHVVVHQLGGGGVVADDDEAGRHGDFRLLPEPEGVFVERIERGAKLGRQARRIEGARLAAAPSGHPSTDVLPQARYMGISLPGTLSATGTRGSLTIPHSMASMREKSYIVQGNRVPSA